MRLRLIAISLFFPVILMGQKAPAGAVLKADDMLIPADPGSVIIRGMLGQKLDSCIKNGVMRKHYDLYSIAYRDKLDDDGGFRGEFWGKWETSAALAYRHQPKPEIKEAMLKAESALINTQQYNLEI